MAIHVGIDPSKGLANAYNEATKEIIKFKVEQILSEGFGSCDALFQKIKTKLNGLAPLGYACIYLSSEYNSDIRKEIISKSKENGFMDAQIIDFETLVYLMSISQLMRNILKPADLIWIVSKTTMFVWEKTHQNSKAKLKKRSNNFAFENQKDLRKISAELCFGKHPSLIIYDQSYLILHDTIHEIFPKCICVDYKNFRDTAGGALIKAQIMAKNKEVMDFDTIDELHDDVEFIIDEVQRSMFFSKGTPLPIEKTIDLLKTSFKIDILNIETEGKTRKSHNLFKQQMQIICPPYKKLALTFKIDVNQVCDIFITTLVDPSNNKLQTESLNRDKKNVSSSLPKNSNNKNDSTTKNQFVNKPGISIQMPEIPTPMQSEPSKDKIHVEPLLNNLEKASIVSPQTNLILDSKFIKIEKLLNSYDSENFNFEKWYKIPQKIKSRDSEINAIGIDFGNSKCCVAINRQKIIEPINFYKNFGENPSLPSFVSRINERNSKCGNEVIENLKSYANFTLFDMKRIFGMDFSKVNQSESWPFKVIEVDGEKPLIKFQRNDGLIDIHPVEGVSILLKHIKDKVEKESHKNNLKEVVVTVPVSFNDNQKLAIFIAAKLAGWNTIHLLPESVAAIFGYFIDKPLNRKQQQQSIKNILLFDFGSSKLDICVFKIENKFDLHFLGEAGNPQLGGRDFDEILVKHFKNILNQKYKKDINDSPEKKMHLLEKCIDIKHALSLKNKATLKVAVAFNPNADDRITITRDKFESMAIPLLDETRKVIQEALFNANLSNYEIEMVLKIGGTCQFSMINKLIHEMLPNANGKEIIISNEIIAMGAAYYSFEKQKESENSAHNNGRSSNHRSFPCCFL